jgi:hypothetical protein
MQKIVCGTRFAKIKQKFCKHGNNEEALQEKPSSLSAMLLVGDRFRILPRSARRKPTSAACAAPIASICRVPSPRVPPWLIERDDALPLPEGVCHSTGIWAGDALSSAHFLSGGAHVLQLAFIAVLSEISRR